MPGSRRRPRWRALLFLVCLGALGCGSFGAIAKLTAMGRSHELRDEGQHRAQAASAKPGLLIVGIDGMKRDVLYELLRADVLPGLASLLGGGAHGDFPHAYLSDAMRAGLPSITIVGWAAIFSGAPPAANGITGNEFFVREDRRLAAPIPGSFEDATPKLATYTDDYVDALLRVPTLYERLRAADPGLRAWVSVSQIHRGADRLLIAERRAIAGKAYATTRAAVTSQSAATYEERDREVLENVVDELGHDDHPVPDVLTVYASGTDGYAHVAPEGPDAALRRVMTDTVDAELARLHDALVRRGALANRWVIVVADHGHSPVPEDGSTLITTAPRTLLASAGFRVRPFALDVDDDADFQSVLAYQGPLAYVYVADRSTCAAPGEPCDWRRPPRFRADVLRVAEAFFQANRTGRGAPGLRGTLDLVLTRRPRPFAEDDLPFQVYVGGGRLVSIATYLRRHPHPTWVDVDRRLRELAVGRYGERAGDVLLVARSGDGLGPAGRYYFDSGPLRSVHGSPSRADGEVPLIVAHPGHDADEIRRRVTAVLGTHPLIRQVTDLALDLRRQ